MPPWWTQPNKPEPEETPVEATEQEVDLSEEGKRKAWRLLALLETMRKRRPDEPISLDEIDLLGLVAAGHYDLHDACAAIRNGCTLDLLVVIFT